MESDTWDGGESGGPGSSYKSGRVISMSMSIEATGLGDSAWEIMANREYTSSMLLFGLAVKFNVYREAK